MQKVTTPSGEVFPTVAAARWSAYFDKLVGRQCREWFPNGLRGLPPGFIVKYHTWKLVNGVPKDVPDE